MKHSHPFDPSDEWNDLDASRQPDDSRPEACLVCEALCPDAVDGTLTEAERKAFDKHVAGCALCAQELEEAQRGAAWLGLLKSKAPEPPATLLARILAETTGTLEAAAMPMQAVAAVELSSATVASRTLPSSSPPTGLPGEGGIKLTAAQAAAAQAASGAAIQPGRILAFPRLPQLNGLRDGFFAKGPGLHPRFAMTAAMAFFSVALTLNLTGVRLGDLRAADLRPSSLQRSAATVEASAMRSFQNLRVVYQVESRVSELRQDPLWEDQAGARARATSKQKNSGQPQDRGQD